MVQEEHDEMLILLCNFLIHYLRNGIKSKL